jgi:hypothetical protein
MKRAISWRGAGATSVVVFQFLIVFGQGGIPSGTWWDEVTDLPVLFTVLVGFGALAYGVDGVFASGRAAREEIRADLERLARRAFVPINARLPEVPINRLGVHVWRTKGERLERLIKYTMEHQRVETPIQWSRGKGAIGVAWEGGGPLTADLTPLYAKADELGSSFDALPPHERYGLTLKEVHQGNRYKSVLAYPLSSVDGEIIGILSVDCAEAGHATELASLVDDRLFQDVLGSCESALRRYVAR